MPSTDSTTTKKKKTAKKTAKKSEAAAPASRLPAAIRKELQKTVAVFCADKIHSQSGMSEAAQQRKVEELFFGSDTNEDLQAAVDLLISGKSPFEKLFDRKEQIVVDASTNTQTSAERLYLKPSLSLRPRDNFTVGTDITKELVSIVSATTKDKATGRYLLDQARNAVKNVKKAIAIARAWMLVNKDTFELPSGTTLDDLIEHILAEMYLQAKGSGSASGTAPAAGDESGGEEDDSGGDSTGPSGDNEDADSSDEEEEEEEEGTTGNSKEEDKDNGSKKKKKSLKKTKPKKSSRPEGWFFPGFYAFVIFGPYGNPDRDQLKLFETDDPKKSATNSRKEARKQARKEKKAERDAALKGHLAKDPRNPSREAQFRMMEAKLRQELLDLGAREIDQQGLQLQIHQNNKSIEAAMTIIKAANIPYDTEHTLWKDVLEGYEEGKRLNKLFAEREDKKRGEKRPAIVDLTCTSVVSKKVGSTRSKSSLGSLSPATLPTGLPVEVACVGTPKATGNEIDDSDEE